MTTDADQLRAELVRALTEGGYLADPAWRDAVAMVPRHAFTPGFYLRSEPSPLGTSGLPVWEPITEKTDRDRWLTAAYSDQTLITQLDEIEEDWDSPQVRHGGVFTSSATLPSLVVTMWTDADIHDGHHVLEIGTGTGYSTALACERLGSKLVTSLEVDPARLEHAHRGLTACGYAPRLARADGGFGYWPHAPFDRVVAACSMRHVSAALVDQTSPGGKLLLPLSGWLGGNARALLTVEAEGHASGPLLDGTISFMMARAQAPPWFGNPRQWAALADGRPARPVIHPPDRISGQTKETFFTQFLTQCAVPNTQRTWDNGTLLLVDLRTGSVAVLETADTGWRVRQSGPLNLWDRVEEVLDAYDNAGLPDQTEFRMRVTRTGQYLEHPRMPPLTIAP